MISRVIPRPRRRLLPRSSTVVTFSFLLAPFFWLRCQSQETAAITPASSHYAVVIGHVKAARRPPCPLGLGRDIDAGHGTALAEFYTL